MKQRKSLIALGGSVLLGMSGVSYAAEPPAGDLKSELAELRARIAELEGRQSDTWLNERRAEEVKGLVREVLADADTRASLMENGLTAGYQRGFFLASEDGQFLLRIGGQLQLRYVANFRDSAPDTVTVEGEDEPTLGGDDNEQGFQFRRAKIGFEGHIGSPKIGYKVVLAADRNSGTVFAEELVISREVLDGLTLMGGRFKAPFLREELTSSRRQLAVERSVMNEIFTTGWSEGVGAVYKSDMFRLSGMIGDGRNAGETGAAKDFHNDAADFAVTGRADLKLAGNWKQIDDFSAWRDEPLAIFVGAGIHYEVGETGDNQIASPLADSVLGWTVDGSVETGGFNAFAAFAGHHFDGPSGVANVDAYGLVVQAGYMLIPDKLEPFARYELLLPDKDLADNDAIHIISVGANYYVIKHAAKFSVDLVWALDPLSATNMTAMGGPTSFSGLGLLRDRDGSDDQVALRAQFQLLF